MQVAYEKMYGLLEDSGYALVEPGNEEEDEEESPGLPSVGIYT